MILSIAKPRLKILSTNQILNFLRISFSDVILMDWCTNKHNYKNCSKWKQPQIELVKRQHFLYTLDTFIYISDCQNKKIPWVDLHIVKGPTRTVLKLEEIIFFCRSGEIFQDKPIETTK